MVSITDGPIIVFREEETFFRKGILMKPTSKINLKPLLSEISHTVYMETSRTS